MLIHQLSVILPVYNEPAVWESSVRQIADTLASHSELQTIEIIVVDDASDIPLPSTLTHPRAKIRILRHERNVGYGASLKSGIQAAAHPWILISDADGTYPAYEIPRLLDVARPQHMVIGVRADIRYLEGHAVKMTLRQMVRSWLFLLSGHWIKDFNSGMRLFERDWVLPLFPSLSDRFSFTTSLTLLSLFQKRPINEVEIAYLKRTGESKIRFLKDGVRLIRQTLLLTWRHRIR